MTKSKNICIKNIYYMLSYAFYLLDENIENEVQGEVFEDIYNLFAVLLSNNIARQIKRGLYKEYVNVIDDIPIIKGKINIPGTIRNRIANKTAISCEYDELTENNILNSIIKTTVNLLIKNLEDGFEYKEKLKKEMVFFSSVDEIDPSLIQWSLLSFNKCNRSYKTLILLCRFLIESMLLTTEDGEHRLASIKDEHMHRLFEKFVLEYYKKEYPHLKARSSQIDWVLDNDEHEYLPKMQSDIMLTSENNILIIDTKFYSHLAQEQYNVRTMRSTNLYQIYTYVKNKQLSPESMNKKVSGMLLYANTDEDVQSNHDYLMSGNIISVRTLDLNIEFSEIKKQLNLIADSLTQREQQI